MWCVLSIAGMRKGVRLDEMVLGRSIELSVVGINPKNPSATYVIIINVIF